MASSSELRSLKSSYENDLSYLKNAKNHLEKAKSELKDDPIDSLVKILEDNLVVDDKYYEKDEIIFSYNSISNISNSIQDYISSVEGKISSLEQEIRLAESREAAENANNS